MARLQTTSNHDQISSDEIIDTLLVEAGAAGALPTDEKLLLEFLGFEQMTFDFMEELRFVDPADRPSGDIRAAVHLADSLIATQTGMGDKRTRFCIFHEIAHCLLPEHRGSFFVDSDQTLSWWTKARLEREANQFAADLLFQGDLFTNYALQNPLSLKTALDLAPTFGASFEAAFRRYAETQVDPCAVIVFDKVRQSIEDYVEDDDYKLQYMIASQSFRKTYFSGLRTTTETCKAAEIFAPSASCRVGTLAETSLVVEGDGQSSLHFESEVFNNGYKIFQFIRPEKKGRSR